MDNNFLIYVFILVKLDVIGYCWIVVLFVYNFIIIYKLGKFNLDVDGLFWVLEIIDCDIVKVICNL